MVHSFHDITHFLETLHSSLPTLEDRLCHMKQVLNAIGNPQDTIPAIHIAGTSGKGSTAYYCASLLQSMNYKTGLLVSPHVTSIAERTQIDGNLLPEEEYCGYFNQFLELVEKHSFSLSYVEFMTTFSFWLFHKMKVDYIVIEVGLGGRLDTTNVMNRSDKVCVITDIGFDHMEILGDTLFKIATQKAGIIHHSNEVVMYEQSEEVMSAVQKVLTHIGAKLTVCRSHSLTLSSLPLYQERNWYLAHAAVSKRLSLDGQPPLTKKAEQKSRLISIPGRFESCTYQSVDIILDAAHNPQKLHALIESVKAFTPDRPCLFLVAFGVHKYVQLDENLSLLQPLAEELITTCFSLADSSHQQAIDPTTLSQHASALGIATVTSTSTALEGLQTALKSAHSYNHPLLVITGSFYLLDNLRPVLISQAN